MVYLYSVPLRPTGPLITHYTIHPINFVDLYKVSLFSPEQFNMTPVKALDNDTFNDHFESLSHFQNVVNVIGYSRYGTYSWATDTHVHTISWLDDKTVQYLRKKGCLQKEIQLYKEVLTVGFSFKCYPAGSSTALYLGQHRIMALNKQNIQNLNIPRCSIEHCIRETLFKMIDNEGLQKKIFSEDGNQYVIHKDTVRLKHKV